MKKSIVALAVSALCASSVNAANIYDKDGTTLDVQGRVQAVYYSGNQKAATDHKSSIADQFRFGLVGRTQLTDKIAAFGAYEIQSDHEGDSTETQDQKTSDAYVGVDFGKFGAVQAGRMPSNIYYVTELTDIFDDWGCAGVAGNDDTRNSGKVQYKWSGYGVDFGLGAQTAINNYTIGDFETNVKGGFSVTAGYTSPVVLFGPVQIRAGYEYLKGQDNGDNTSEFSNIKTASAGLAWGGDTGFYTAIDYTYRKFNLRSGRTAAYNDAKIGDVKFYGLEFVLAYNFESGITVAAGYEATKVKFDGYSFKSKKVPVYVNYQVNEQFNVWIEAQFDAGSDEFKIPGVVSDNIFDRHQNQYSVGMRYTF